MSGALRDRRRQGFFPADELDRSAFVIDLGRAPRGRKCRVSRLRPARSAMGCRSALGWRISVRMRAARSRVFVVVGDGEINEGSVWEAALSAHKHRLSNLTVMVDYNKIQSAGPVAEILDLEPLADKWRAFGFGVARGRRPRRRGTAARLGALPLELTGRLRSSATP